MPRRSKIVNMSLPPELLLQVEEMARQRGVPKSHILREALKDYIASERRWERIRRWGEESARRLRIRDEEDVDRLIHEFRRESRC